jgi:hypothetical protein
VFTHVCDRKNFCIDSVLKHCVANRKRRLSALPNVGPYIYDVRVSGFTRSSTHIYYISRLRVNSRPKNILGITLSGFIVRGKS